MAGYTPQTWQDGNASYPASAARMLVMEDGIYRAHPQVVTTLPSTSFDGMQIRVRVPATVQAFEAWWTFARDSSNATQQPWGFIGGAPAGADTFASFSTAATSYTADSTNGPRVTVPFLGYYLVTYGALMANNTAGAYCTASLSYGAAASQNDEVRYTSAIANASGHASRTHLIQITNANQMIELQYGVSAGTGTFTGRFMHVTPVRVGP